MAGAALLWSEIFRLYLHLTDKYLRHVFIFAALLPKSALAEAVLIIFIVYSFRKRRAISRGTGADPSRPLRKYHPRLVALPEVKGTILFFGCFMMLLDFLLLFESSYEHSDGAVGYPILCIFLFFKLSATLIIGAFLGRPKSATVPFSLFSFIALALEAFSYAVLSFALSGTHTPFNLVSQFQILFMGFSTVMIMALAVYELHRTRQTAQAIGPWEPEISEPDWLEEEIPAPSEVTDEEIVPPLPMPFAHKMKLVILAAAVVAFCLVYAFVGRLYPFTLPKVDMTILMDSKYVNSLGSLRTGTPAPDVPVFVSVTPRIRERLYWGDGTNQGSPAKPALFYTYTDRDGKIAIPDKTYWTFIRSHFMNSMSDGDVAFYIMNDGRDLQLQRPMDNPSVRVGGLAELNALLKTHAPKPLWAQDRKRDRSRQWEKSLSQIWWEEFKRWMWGKEWEFPK